MSSDQDDLIARLNQLASRYEDAARRIREAAAVIREVPTLPSASDGKTDTEPGFRIETVTPIKRRGGGITEAEYMEFLLNQGPQEWTAQSLFDGLAAAGKPVASPDAVRTAIYRLEKAGHLVKTGHGRFRAPAARSFQTNGPA